MRSSVSRRAEAPSSPATAAARETELLHLLEQAEARDRQLRAMHTSLVDSWLAISSSLELPRVLDRIVTVAASILNSQHGVLSLLDDETLTIQLAALHGFSLDPDRYHAPDERAATWEIIRKCQPLEIQDLPHCSYTIMRQIACEFDFKTFFGVPMLARGRPMGALKVYFTAPRVFSQTEREALMTLATQAAIAIENARLYESVRRQKAELEALVQDLRALDQMKSTFLSTVSHELRTPLSAIKGFCTSLLRADVRWKAPTRRDFLQRIDAQTDTLTELVGDLLDMSRLEAGMLRLDKTWCRVEEIVPLALGKLSSIFPSTRITVVAQETVPVYADRRQVARVIWNLVENAVKYSPPGSPVALWFLPGVDCAVVAVQDEGPGIPAEHVPYIFDRFYRVEGVRASGVGLGLAICRGIVEAHGGRIGIMSERDQGTTVWFTLPAIGTDDEE